MMQASVIIPTYNRVKDVDACLNSIIVQTTLPKEIIIVDDSDTTEVENLIEQRKGGFKDKDMDVIYLRNRREKSLTIARNIGIDHATGDIILFIDSDVVLDNNYIKEILKVYKKRGDALGVQGLIQRKKDDRVILKFVDAFNKLFYIYLREETTCRLLPSLGVSYPSSVDGIINCEWLSGANQSYRKDIFEEFRFDENLKKYSQGEDIDLPYRIFKKYPHSLFMTPHAKLIHNTSQGGRHPKRDVIYMDEIYLLYLFYKNMDQNLKNKLIYLWSRVGRTIFNTIFLILKSKSKLVEIRYRIGAPIYCMRHVGEIKKGDLEFFNKELKL